MEDRTNLVEGQHRPFRKAFSRQAIRRSPSTGLRFEERNYVFRIEMPSLQLDVKFSTHQPGENSGVTDEHTSYLEGISQSAMLDGK